MSVDLKVNTKQGVEELDKLLKKLQAVHEKIEKIEKAGLSSTKKSGKDSSDKKSIDNLKKSEDKKTKIVKEGVKDRVDAIADGVAQEEKIESSGMTRSKKRRNFHRDGLDKLERTYRLRKISSARQEIKDLQAIEDKAWKEHLDSMDKANREALKLAEKAENLHTKVVKDGIRARNKLEAKNRIAEAAKIATEKRSNLKQASILSSFEAADAKYTAEKINSQKLHLNDLQAIEDKAWKEHLDNMDKTNAETIKLTRQMEDLHTKVVKDGARARKAEKDRVAREERDILSKLAKEEKEQAAKKEKAVRAERAILSKLAKEEKEQAAKREKDRKAREKKEDAEKAKRAKLRADYIARENAIFRKMKVPVGQRLRVIEEEVSSDNRRKEAEENKKALADQARVAQEKAKIVTIGQKLRANEEYAAVEALKSRAARRKGIKKIADAEIKDQQDNLTQTKKLQAESLKLFNKHQNDITAAAARLENLRANPMNVNRRAIQASGTPAEQRALTSLDRNTALAEAALAFTRENAKRQGVSGLDLREGVTVSKGIEKSVIDDFDRFNKKVKESGGVASRASSAFRSIADRSFVMSRGIIGATKSFGNFIGTGLRIGALSLGVATLATGLHTLNSELDRLLEVSALIDRTRNTLTFALGSDKSASKELEYLVDLSKRYNLNIEAILKSSGKFYASAAQIGIPLNDIRSVFEGVSQAQAVFRLSSEETEGVMFALSQMASKGKVSMEELRLQLAERLPGTLAIAAKAMGVTTAQLDKLITSGQLLSKDFLPLFGREIQRTLGPAAAKVGAGVTGSLEAIKNVGFEFRKSIFDNKEKEIIDVLSIFRTELKKVLDSFADFASEDVFEALKGGVESLSIAFQGLSDATKILLNSVGVQTILSKNTVSKLESDVARRSFSDFFDPFAVLQGRIPGVRRLSGIAAGESRADILTGEEGQKFVFQGSGDAQATRERLQKEASERGTKILFRRAEGLGEDLADTLFEIFEVTKELAEKEAEYSTDQLRARALKQKSEGALQAAEIRKLRDLMLIGGTRRFLTEFQANPILGPQNLPGSKFEQTPAAKFGPQPLPFSNMLSTGYMVSKEKRARLNALIGPRIAASAEKTTKAQFDEYAENDRIIRERYRDILRMERRKQLASLTQSVLGLESGAGGQLSSFFTKRRQLIEARVGGAINEGDFKELESLIFKSEVLGKKDTIAFQKVMADKIVKDSQDIVAKLGSSIRISDTDIGQQRMFAGIENILSSPTFNASREDIAKTLYSALILDPLESITDPSTQKATLERIKAKVAKITGVEVSKVDSGMILEQDIGELVDGLSEITGLKIEASAEEFFNNVAAAMRAVTSRDEAVENARVVQLAEKIATGNIQSLAKFISDSVESISFPDALKGAQKIFDEEFEKEFTLKMQSLQFDPLNVNKGYDEIIKWVKSQSEAQKSTQEKAEQALAKIQEDRAGKIKSFLGIQTFQDEATILRQRMEMLDDLYNHEDEKIRINAQTKAFYEFEFRRELDETFKKQVQATENYRAAFRSMFGDMQNAFIEFVKTGEFSFNNMIENMLAKLLELQFQMRVIEPLMEGISSGQTPNWFGALFGGFAKGAGRASTAAEAAKAASVPTASASVVAVKGAPNLIGSVSGGDFTFSGMRSTGGDVLAGRSYRVNERPSSPEVFLPGMDGKMMPINKLGGGSNVNIVVNNSTNSEVAVNQSTDDGGNINIELMITDVVNTGLSSGKFDRAFKNNFKLSRQGY